MLQHIDGVLRVGNLFGSQSVGPALGHRLDKAVKRAKAFEREAVHRLLLRLLDVHLDEVGLLCESRECE